MKRGCEHIAAAALFALCVAAPAFAATINGVGDPDLRNPGLDVTSHAMPPPDVTAKTPAEAPVIEKTPASSANPLWAIPLSALSATRNRPLFTPSRRPPAPVIASVPPPPPPRVASPPPLPEHPNLILVGTVAGSGEGIAVFIDQTTRTTVRLRTGQDHSGWILESIDRGNATLQKGNQTETLTLPRPGDVQAAGPVISPLPPPPIPKVPAPVNLPPGQGCMPEPIGC